MATIAQIRADLVGSSASFRAEMIAGQRQANESMALIRREVLNTSDSLRTLNTAAAGLVGFEAIKGAVQSLLDAQKAAQQIHFSLVSATGSTTAADAAYKAVSATAEQLGLDLKSSALGFSSMSAAAAANGVSMREQQALFEGLARSSTVLHLSSEQTGRAIAALSQIFGKGKIQAEELRQQLGDAVPGVVPRFQQAVMTMAKGTELAGKSFDQLLQNGDVTVKRFLPALIQAFNETGKGAEQAAGGLNASINRLSTEWFKLKTDLSGGLFSDAATASIELVTHNLENLANVAGITGGLVVARLAGGGLGKAASGASALVQQQQEAREAAVAASELAARQVEATAAEVKHNEAALAGVTTAKQQAFAQREAAQALYQKAVAENEAAQATLAHQRTTVTLSANLRAQREATAQAALAQQNMTRAQAQYDATVAGGNALKQQQIALDTRLIEVRAASAAATEAQALAERQLATTSAAGLLARGASGLGNFALGLVGGPWGAAVAAIGAVGYAIYDVQKKSEDWRKETQAQVDSIQQMRDQVQAAAKDYGSLHAAMGLSQSLDLYKQSTGGLQKQRDDIAQLEQEAAKLEGRINARSSVSSGGGAAVADWFDGRKLEEIRDRIRELSDQLPATQQNVDALGAKLAGSFAPSIEAVRGAIDRLKAGGNLGDMLSGWSAGIDTAIKNVEQARQKAQQIQAELQANTQTLTKQAATDGMNNAQKQQYLLRQGIEQIRAQKLAPGDERGQIADLSASAAKAIQAGAQKDAADAAKKAASEAISQAKQYAETTQRLIDEAKQHAAVLNEQADGTQKLTESEAKLAAFEQELLTTKNKSLVARASELRAILQENAAKEVAQRQAQQEAAALARSVVLRDQLSARIDRQNETNNLAVAGVGHGQELTQQLQDEIRIRQEYDRQRQQYDKQAGQLKPGVAGSVGSTRYNDDVASMMASQQQELAIYRAGVQARLEAEKDWTNGAQAALEDYASAASDVAGQTKQAFSNAFGGLEDDLTSLELTGKIKFSSLTNSIIADIARMNAKAATSAIVGYATKAVSAYFGYDASGGAGASTYGNNGQVTHVDFGGGRATGGGTAGGTMYEVAEGGRPELYQSGGRTYLLSGKDGYVTPASPGRGGAASVGATGGGGGLVVNVINSQGDKVQATAKESNGPGGRQIDILIDAVEQKMAGNVSRGQGPMSSALSSRYGLNKGQTL